MVIRKKSTIILMFLLFSTVALSLSTITQFSTGKTAELLEFEGNSEKNVTINLWGDSYVLNANMTVTGMLSEWVTESYYSNLNSPQDAEYVSDSKWVIADMSNNRVLIINPKTKNIELNYTALSAPNDVEYVNVDTLLITDTGNDRIILLENISTTPTPVLIYNYSQPDPIFFDADLIGNQKLLVTDKANKIVRLINITTGEDIANYSTGPYDPFDAEYITDEIWLISETTRVIKINSTSDTVIYEYSTLPKTVYDVESVDSDKKLLITVSDEVFLVNVSNNVTLSSYSKSLTSAKDAEYISDVELLITDETGSKRVSLEKKYYPSNLNLTIGNDTVWTWPNELNTTTSINDSHNVAQAMNDYLINICNNLTGNCTIPFTFHSDTYGKLNVTNLRVIVDRKPSITVLSPNGGESWAGIQAVRWNATDEDNDNLVMNVSYWNSTDWVQINVTTGPPRVYTYNWNTTTVEDRNNKYLIKVSVTDLYSPAVNDTSDNNFTIDNTLPTVTLNYPNGSELLKGNITINWTANDNIDNNLTISLEYTTDGNTWTQIAAGLEDDGNETWDTTGINSETVRIRINATDDAGNTKSDMSDNNFTIDNTAPRIVLLNPADNHNETNNSTITFEFNTTDNINNTLWCELYINSKLEGNKTINSGTINNFTKDTGEGHFIWLVKCFDGINYNQSENRTLTVDTKLNEPQFLPTTTIKTTTKLLQLVFDEPVTINQANFSNKIITFTTNDNQTFNYTATGLSNGNYLLKVNVTDGYNTKEFNHTYTVSIPSNSGGSSGGGGGSRYCQPSWDCTEWGPCTITGIKTRTCTDKNHCGTNTGMPAITQTCNYTQPFANFGSGENLLQPEEQQEEQQEQQQEEETGNKEEQSGTPTGAVTGGFFNSTTGKITLGIFILLITGALTIVIRNAILNRTNSVPPRKEF